MTKQYNTPMLQIVCINKNDIIATSGNQPLGFGDDLSSGMGTIEASAPDRFNWDAGY